jgi:uncharacterized protein
MESAIGGHLAENIAHFGRALRIAGLSVGPGSVLDAIEAVSQIGLGHREEFRAALRAVFVKRRADLDLFEQAFRLFWRRRALLEKMMAELMPLAPSNPADKREETLRRISEALSGARPPEDVPQKNQLDLYARLTVSDAEMFKTRDFEQMSALELLAAKAAIARLELPLQRVRTRRFQPSLARALLDPRRAMRASLRGGGASIVLKFRQRAHITPPLVALCDISGSMSQYSRIFLHFLHALAQTGRKVHAFTFATELTNITPALKASKDPDHALAEAAKLVRDWDGGTRIGQTLERFNKDWGRRVLSNGAIVLLVTDGLERRLGDDLPRELARLRRSSRRLIWLNPLLRFEGFEAKASGIKLMLPHVDEFRAVHNLNSITELCAALSAEGSRQADPRRTIEAFAA